MSDNEKQSLERILQGMWQLGGAFYEFARDIQEALAEHDAALISATLRCAAELAYWRIMQNPTSATTDSANFVRDSINKITPADVAAWQAVRKET